VISSFTREDDPTYEMVAANKSEQDLISENMASSVVLKTAKRELRALMKEKLSNISSESVYAQSRL
jgi:hypothetical protein